MTKDDGYELLWPKTPASKWWLVVGFVCGIAAMFAIVALMALEGAM